MNESVEKVTRQINYPQSILIIVDAVGEIQRNRGFEVKAEKYDAYLNAVKSLKNLIYPYLQMDGININLSVECKSADANSEKWDAAFSEVERGFCEIMVLLEKHNFLVPSRLSNTDDLLVER